MRLGTIRIGISDCFSGLLIRFGIDAVLTPEQPYIKNPNATTIHELNDDVLRKTFGHLDISDLCSAADVCQNFKRNARAVYLARSKGGCFCVRSNSISVEKMGKSESIRPRILLSVMRNFGKLSVSLAESAREQSARTLNLIGQYCGRYRIDIELTNFVFTNDVIPTMRPLLSRVRTLSLLSCMLQPGFNASEMLACCPELDALRIFLIKNLQGEHSALRFQVKIPKLKSLTIDCCKGIEDMSIVEFLEMNPQLVGVTIFECKNITSRIIPSIVQYTPRVEKVSFIQNIVMNDFFGNMEKLMQLSTLKTVGLGGPSAISLISISSIVSKLAAAQTPLETLLLWHCVSDEELVTQTAQLKTLKTLQLTNLYRMTMPDVIAIIKQLPELSSLWIFDMDILDTDLVNIIRSVPKLRCLTLRHSKPTFIDRKFYMEIVDAAAARAEKCCLELVFLRANHSALTVPTHLLEANEQFLHIKLGA